MPAPTVTVEWPPAAGVDLPANMLRPEAHVVWTGGTGPFDVLHEWDTVNTFDSGDLIQDSNTGASSPDTGVPPSDMPGVSTSWWYRVTVTDTDDSTSTTTSAVAFDFVDPVDFWRFLYLYANVGVGFDPIDTPTAGWDPESIGTPDAGDGYAIDFWRFLYLYANVGVGFDPTDTPAGGWDQGGGGDAGDGYTEDFWRFLYLLGNVGVGFDPTDTPAGGWGPGAGDAGDGYTEDFARFLYLQALVDTTTPTPHIWYLFPTFGREGWEFRIVGYGFGDTQATFGGSATLNGLAVDVLSWELVAESDPALTINPQTNTAEPIHQLIRAAVPEGASSGLVIVCHDGP
jgi:hypothetical protein